MKTYCKHDGNALSTKRVQIADNGAEKQVKSNVKTHSALLSITNYFDIYAHKIGSQIMPSRFIVSHVSAHGVGAPAFFFFHMEQYFPSGWTSHV